MIQSDGTIRWYNQMVQSDGTIWWYNQMVQSDVDSMQGRYTVNFVTFSITKTCALWHFLLDEYLCIFILFIMVLLTTGKF